MCRNLVKKQSLSVSSINLKMGIAFRVVVTRYATKLDVRVERYPALSIYI